MRCISMNLREILENLDPDLTSFKIGVRNKIYFIETSTNYGSLNVTKYSDISDLEEHVEGLLVEKDDSDLL